MTRRLLLLLCLCPLLCAAASAYIVTIAAPGTLTSGEPLIVNGTSTLPAGYTHDLVVYSGPSERAQTTIVVQQGGSFSGHFDTAGLPTGTYRVELVPPSDPGFFGSDSVTSRMVTIVDRSKEVTVTSPAAQGDVQNLTVSGISPGKKSGSIAIAVTGPANYTFGPEYVPTDANGAFSKTVPIRGPGEYRVSLSDPTGLIMRYTVTVTGEPRSGASATVPPILTSTAATSAAAQTATAPITAATTRAPLSPLAALGAGLLLLLLVRRR